MGEYKPIMQLMMAELDLSYKTVCHFLGTFCIQKVELCRLGHQMEPIYGCNLLEAGKNGIKLEDGSVLVTQHLFRVGTVHKRGKKHQKDSPEFSLLGTLDGQPIVAVVNLKCRSKAKMQNRLPGRTRLVRHCRS